MSTINERIKERRQSLNMTLVELADAVGVRDATVQRYESGAIKNISHEMVCKLSEALQCSPAYLMGWESDEAHKEALILYQKYLQAPEQARQSIDYILNMQRPDSEHQ